MANGIYLIFSGGAVVTRRFTGEKIERQIDALETGDSFGEHSVLFKENCQNSVTTTMPTTILFIDKVEIICLDPEMLFDFKVKIKPYPTDEEIVK